VSGVSLGRVFDPGAEARAGVDDSVTTGGAGEAVDLAEPQAGAVAEILGGEEGFERAGSDVRGHAGAVIGDRDDGVVAGRQVVGGGLHGADLVAAADGDGAAFVQQGVAGVADQVHNGGVELGGVHHDRVGGAVQRQGETQLLADQPVEGGLQCLQLGVRVHRGRAQDLAAGVGEQMPGQPGAALGGEQPGLDDLGDVVRIVGAAADQVEAVGDHHQQIVEVVGDGAGQLAHGLHAAGFVQFGFRDGQVGEGGLGVGAQALDLAQIGPDGGAGGE
jgi:hypothetical protein